METHDTKLEITTLGRFSMSLEGTPVATTWPDETVKALFCSLFSPLNRHFTWDRICRSIWGVPATQTSRRRLEEVFIRPLNDFLIDELGFSPLISGDEGIRLDYRRIQVDAFEFHSTALEGLRLLSIGNHAAARETLSRAESLYGGDYLPGIAGPIITNARTGLESLHRTVITDSLPLTRDTGSPVPDRMTGFGQYMSAATARTHLYVRP